MANIVESLNEISGKGCGGGYLERCVLLFLIGIVVGFGLFFCGLIGPGLLALWLFLMIIVALCCACKNC